MSEVASPAPVVVGLPLLSSPLVSTAAAIPAATRRATMPAITSVRLRPAGIPAGAGGAPSAAGGPAGSAAAPAGAGVGGAGVSERTVPGDDMTVSPRPAP